MVWPGRHVDQMGDDTIRDQTRTRLLHELRTPLTVLSGRLQFMRRRSSKPGRDIAPTAEEFAILEEAVARLTAAVDDLERETDRQGALD